LATSTHTPIEVPTPTEASTEAAAELAGVSPEATNAAPQRAFDATAGRRIARIFLPSISDCFFIALMAWLFLWGASGWISLLADGDTGWHIRTGQYILEHHSVPTQDLFSFSRAGSPWFAWEWLTDAIYAVLFQIAGLKGIVLMAGLIIALYATVVLRYTLWRGANPLVAAVTTMLAVGASSIHFLARPHLFTLLLLPVCLWMVEADRRARTRWVWALIPVTALWTNLHGGFVVFLVCLALLVLAFAIETALGTPRWPQIRRYSALLLGCSLASVVNPYGIQLHIHIYEYLRADWIKDIVQEFQAPTFRSEGQFQYEVLLLSGLIVIGFLLRRRLFVEALWILFLAHSSLTSVRHAPLYAAVACALDRLRNQRVVACRNRRPEKIFGGANSLPDGVRPGAGFRRTSIWPVLFILVLAALDAPVNWPRDFPSDRFPTAIVHQHAGLIASGRLLTPDQWGDYIIYSFYPRQKVYVDGRSDFYGEKLGQEYLHLMQGAYDWRAIMDRNRFDVALLPVDCRFRRC
jgi:hypothetical protein